MSSSSEYESEAESDEDETSSNEEESEDEVEDVEVDNQVDDVAKAKADAVVKDLALIQRLDNDMNKIRQRLQFRYSRNEEDIQENDLKVNQEVLTLIHMDEKEIIDENEVLEPTNANVTKEEEPHIPLGNESKQTADATTDSDDLELIQTKIQPTPVILPNEENLSSNIEDKLKPKQVKGFIDNECRLIMELRVDPNLQLLRYMKGGEPANPVDDNTQVEQPMFDLDVSVSQEILSQEIPLISVEKQHLSKAIPKVTPRRNHKRMRIAMFPIKLKSSHMREQRSTKQSSAEFSHPKELLSEDKDVNMEDEGDEALPPSAAYSEPEISDIKTVSTSTPLKAIDMNQSLAQVTTKTTIAHDMSEEEFAQECGDEAVVYDEQSEVCSTKASMEPIKETIQALPIKYDDPGTFVDEVLEQMESSHVVPSTLSPSVRNTNEEIIQSMVPDRLDPTPPLTTTNKQENSNTASLKTDVDTHLKTVSIDEIPASNLPPVSNFDFGLSALRAAKLLQKSVRLSKKNDTTIDTHDNTRPNPLAEYSETSLLPVLESHSTNCDITDTFFQESDPRISSTPENTLNIPASQIPSQHTPIDVMPDVSTKIKNSESSQSCNSMSDLPQLRDASRRSVYTNKEPRVGGHILNTTDRSSQNFNSITIPQDSSGTHQEERHPLPTNKQPTRMDLPAQIDAAPLKKGSYQQISRQSVEFSDPHSLGRFAGHDQIDQAQLHVPVAMKERKIMHQETNRSQLLSPKSQMPPKNHSYNNSLYGVAALSTVADKLFRRSPLSKPEIPLSFESNGAATVPAREICDQHGSVERHNLENSLNSNKQQSQGRVVRDSLEEPSEGFTWNPPLSNGTKRHRYDTVTSPSPASGKQQTIEYEVHAMHYLLFGPP